MQMDSTPYQSKETAVQAPPEYDSLPVAPPSINTAGAASSQHDALRASRKKSLKEKWKELKDEDQQRKATRIQHVTHEEADRITGLDKHKRLEAKKSTEERRGMKSLLGILFLS